MPSGLARLCGAARRILPRLLLLLAFASQAHAAPRADKLKQEICERLVEVATWCHENGLGDAAAAHVAEALRLSKNHAAAKALRGNVKPGTTATETATRKYERTVWKRAAARIGALYLRLFREPHGVKQQETWDGYLIRAYVLAPSKARSTFEKIWKAAYKRKDHARVRRLLLAVQGVEDKGAAASARAAALEATAPGNVRVARRLVAFARWCHENGLGGRAAPLLQEALHHDPASASAQELLTLVDATALGDAEAQAAYGAGWESLRPALAAAYAELAEDAGRAAREPKRLYELYLARALGLDGAVMAGRFEKAWRAAETAEAWARVSALLLRAKDVPADEATAAARAQALERAERKLAVTRPIYRAASGHRMRYWLCLPEGWTPDKRWPVVVCCDGRLCIFEARAQSFLRHRGKRPFIIVSPCTFANTNDLRTTLTGFSKGKGFASSKPVNKYLVPQAYRTAREVLQGVVVQHYPDALIDHLNPRRVERAAFDVAGLQAVLADVRKEFGGETRVYITGWSGGGVLTWSLTLGYTHLVAAAAPACANFVAALHKAVAPGQAFSRDPARATLPIRGFQGLKDRYLEMLEGQWAAAERTCAANGFENVARTDLPDVAHKDCVKEVWDFFESTWKSRLPK